MNAQTDASSNDSMSFAEIQKKKKFAFHNPKCVLFLLVGMSGLYSPGVTMGVLAGVVLVGVVILCISSYV